MSPLIIFLIVCLSMALLYVPSLSILIVVIYAFLLIRKKHDLLIKVILFTLLAFLFAYVKYLLSFTHLDMPFRGLVIISKKNYAIIWSKFRLFYLEVKNSDLGVGDILYVKGVVSRAHFQTYEGDFNFTNYLASLGVRQMINNAYYTKIFSNPLNRLIKVKFDESIYNDNALTLIKMFFFNERNYNHELVKNAVSIQVIFLFATSGVHYNFLVRILKWILKFFFSEKRISLIICLLLCLFTISFPFRFTFIRLLVVNLLLYWRLVKKKDIAYLDLLCFSGIFFLFLNPFLITQPSFYLSYGLMILMQLSSGALSYLKKSSRFFASSLLIYIVLIPSRINQSYTFLIFGYFFTMILSPIICLFFTISGFSVFIIPLPKLVNGYADTIFTLTSFLNKINFAMPIGKLTPIFIICYFSLLIALIYFIEIGHLPFKRLTTLVILALFVLHLLPINNLFSEEVTFINVGQGDATLLRQGNKAVLIDTGGLTYKDLASDALIPYFRSRKINKLEAVIITHDDFDHNGALPNLRANFKIGEIISDKSAFPYTFANTKIEYISCEIDSNDENEKSLVLYTKICNLTFLFMGDASSKNEEEIIRNYPFLRADVLKVGHHGSSTSTSEAFLKHIRPKEAVISCGYKNYYNHPAPIVLDRLTRYQIRIRRTDLESSICYKSLSFSFII
jgi:competence protein ComEC